MKKLTCIPKFLFGARFVFAYEAEAKSALENIQPNEQDEKLPEFKDVKKQAEDNLVAKQQEVLHGITESHKAARASEEKELNGMPRSSAKEKADYAKKKKEFEANEARRNADMERAKNEFITAAEAAYKALEKAYTEAHERRTKAAEEFAKSLANELMEARTAERKEKADKDVNDMMGFQPDRAANMQQGALAYQSDVAMPYYIKNADNGKTESAENHPTWNADQVKAATFEMLKAIYIDRGPAEAKAKATELRDACKVDQAGGYVNWFSWHKAFGGDEKGGFGYVLTEMRFDTRKGPELFGKVVGNMNAAMKLFEGKPELMARYEAAVQAAINDANSTMPSPSEWARKNAPETFMQPDKPDAFVDKVLESYDMPAKPSYYDDLKKAPEGAYLYEWPEDKKKAVAEYDAAVAKMNKVRATLLGVLNAQQDPKDWDEVSRKALAAMMGGSFNAKNDKLNKADPDKIKEGREFYGDVGRKLDDESKAYVSGLIYGADVAYGGRQVEIEVNGKKEKRDFVAFYKSVLNESLKNKTDLNAFVRDLHESMRDDQNAIRDNNNGVLPPAERERTEAEYRSKVRELISKNAPTAAEVWKEFQQSQTDSTPAEPAVAATPPPAPGKAPSAGKKAPGTAPAAKPASTPAAPSSTPQSVAGVPIASNAPQTTPSAQPAVPTGTTAEAPAATVAESDQTGSTETVDPRLKKFLQDALKFARDAAKKDKVNPDTSYRTALEIYINNNQRKGSRALLAEETRFSDKTHNYRVSLRRQQDGSVSAEVKTQAPAETASPTSSDTRLAANQPPKAPDEIQF